MAACGSQTESAEGPSESSPTSASVVDSVADTSGVATTPPPTAAPTVAPTSAPQTVPAATAAPLPLMPAVVCMDLQAAQNEIQRAGVFYSRSVDATGQGRLQLIDSNWLVVSQDPAPGVPFGEGDALLGVVKFGEGDC